jgi:hypothetical protein
MLIFTINFLLTKKINKRLRIVRKNLLIPPTHKTACDICANNLHKTLQTRRKLNFYAANARVFVKVTFCKFVYLFLWFPSQFQEMLLILDHCTTHKFLYSSSHSLLRAFVLFWMHEKNWICQRFKSHGNSIKNVPFLLFISARSFFWDKKNFWI